METKPTIEEIKENLEYLRGELRDGTMSYMELAELQGFSGYIESGDVELLEAAGVPEFPEDVLTDEQRQTLADFRELGYATEFRPGYGWIIHDLSNGLTLADVVYAVDNDLMDTLPGITVVQGISDPGLSATDLEFSYYQRLLGFIDAKFDKNPLD